IEMRALRHTAQAVLESTSEGILSIDANGRITLVNRAAERMFGYDRDELRGQTLEVLLPDRFRATHREHRVGYCAAPRVRPMGSGLDLAGRRKDGTEFPVEISLSYVQAPEGMTAMALITDITERKRVEAELVRQREALYQTEKLAALGTLTAGIAHEMNNPLGIITSPIEVMLPDAAEQNLPPQMLEDLRVLDRAPQRVAGIATNLRSFARQTPREHARIDVNAVIQETLLLVGKPLEADHIRVSTRLDPALAPIVGDASTLQQVLLNLITNAREAMESGGGKRVGTGAGGGTGRGGGGGTANGGRLPAEPPSQGGCRVLPATRDGRGGAYRLGAGGRHRYRARHPGRASLEGVRSVLHDQAIGDRARPIRELRNRPGSPRHDRRAVGARARDDVRPGVSGRVGRARLSRREVSDPTTRRRERWLYSPSVKSAAATSATRTAPSATRNTRSPARAAG